MPPWRGQGKLNILVLQRFDSFWNKQFQNNSRSTAEVLEARVSPQRPINIATSFHPWAQYSTTAELFSWNLILSNVTTVLSHSNVVTRRPARTSEHIRNKTRLMFTGEKKIKVSCEDRRARDRQWNEKRNIEVRFCNNRWHGNAVSNKHSEGVSIALVTQRATRIAPYYVRRSIRYPNFFFSGMEADRNVKVVGGDVAVL